MGAELGRREGRSPGVEHTKAICYSGYRDGQSPATQTYPTAAQVLEDLEILQAHGFRHLRLYDASPHADVVLETIRRHELPFKVLLGAWLDAEVSNPKCTWGGVYPDDTLAKNRTANDAQVEQVIALAKRHESLVSGVSTGNEAVVEWTDHLVPVARVVELVERIRKAVGVPVTFCENWVPWTTPALAPLVEAVDFVSMHTYPVWESKGLEASMGWTEENFRAVAAHAKGKPVVITEAGWPTLANGRGFPKEHAGQAQQLAYLERLAAWSADNGVLTFVFEAFDEAWKGSPDPAEPEKHWGLFHADRSPKPVAREGHVFSRTR